MRSRRTSLVAAGIALVLVGVTLQGVSSRPDAAVAAFTQDSWNPAVGWVPHIQKPPANAVDVKSRAVDLPEASDAEAPAAPKTAEGQWISSVRAADDALRTRVKVGVTPRVVSSPIKENNVAVGPPMKADVTGAALRTSRLQRTPVLRRFLRARLRTRSAARLGVLRQMGSMESPSRDSPSRHQLRITETVCFKF